MTRRIVTCEAIHKKDAGKRRKPNLRKKKPPYGGIKIELLRYRMKWI